MPAQLYLPLLLVAVLTVPFALVAVRWRVLTLGGALMAGGIAACVVLGQGWALLVPLFVFLLSGVLLGRLNKDFGTDAKHGKPRDAVQVFCNGGVYALLAAHDDFQRRAAGGVPDEIPELALSGAPLAIGNLLKLSGLVPSTSEALRMVEQGGVRVDGGAVSDKGLKLAAGTYVVQVGKRKFARVTLTA
jgi:ribosome-associated protein YbcJ (S4-like RNA binding protein)